MPSASDTLVPPAVLSPPAPLCVNAPIAGWTTPLEEVSDPVFAGRILGDGVAIDPIENVLRAPCAGVVIMLHRAHHAITLRAENGAELLMHIGLETVALNGTGFTPLVEAGQTVAAGDRLIEFDLEAIARKAPSLLVPVIITNPDAFTVAERTTDQAIKAGALLFRLTPSGAAAAVHVETSGQPNAVRRNVHLVAQNSNPMPKQ